VSDDSALWLLALGPAGATGLYWMLYRYYRNTDKSHAFERETRIEAQPVTGDDARIGEITGTRATSIGGDNLREYRQRAKEVAVTRTDNDVPS
jgi:hypothetical protein